MENDIGQNNNLIPTNAPDIVKKFRSLQDRMNFCLEKNWHHPQEVGFDATYFLKVLSGKKKYLPANFSINYKMRYFRSGEKLDKQYIIKKMMNNPMYAQYTPDHINPMKYSKSFLLNLIAYIDPPLFQSLYATQKKQLINKTFNMWQNYKINIQDNLINDIQNFCPINSIKSNQNGFRTIKNHRQLEFFLNQMKNKI